MGLILIVSLVLTATPASKQKIMAISQSTIPSGYIGIYDADDLAGIANKPRANYILMNDKKWFLMEHEEYGTRAAYVILSEDGAVVMNDCYNGFDEEARRNIQNFMQQQAVKEQEQQRQQQVQSQMQPNQTQQPPEQQKKKPELANWQKVMDNGEYLRSAEMAEEANYNMIDGLMNNTPKKKDKNAPRRSVLKRLRNHQKKIASQGKGQPQQQKAVEEEMERNKK